MPIKMGAKTCNSKKKRVKGQLCRQPAMRNGRCRLHGGKSTGPKTIEGKKKAAQANYKHGRYTNAAIAERKRMRGYMGWRKDLSDFF